MASDVLRWQFRPELTRPVLVAAFEGWNDAGDAATTAVRHLVETWRANTFADIDPEEFYDFTSTRPHVRLVDGLTRKLDWPANTFSVGAADSAGANVVLLVGSEPQLKWRTFCAHIIQVAQSLNVEMVVTLGALLADVPHSKPVRITGTAGDAALVEALQLERSRYEGPTGIVGVLHDALATAGVKSASLWGAMPHYLPGTPSPKGALALLERLGVLLRLPIQTLDLQIATAQYERQVTEVVEGDEDMARYVRQLEEAYTDADDEDDDADDHFDAGPLAADASELPTADSLAAEVEQYLRDHDR
jgi:proteasome assembly chaperone (PAC2) family protein